MQKALRFVALAIIATVAASTAPIRPGLHITASEAGVKSLIGDVLPLINAKLKATTISVPPITLDEHVIEPIGHITPERERRNRPSHLFCKT